MSNTFGFQSPYTSKPTSSSLSLSLPSAHSTCQLIFCLLLPPASRLNPRCSPPLLGWIFPLHSITHVSSRQLPPWGCSSTPGGVTRAQGKWASVSLCRHSIGCSLAVFLASNSSSPPPPMSTCAHQLSEHFLFSHQTIQSCFQREIWLLRVPEKSTITFYCSKSAGLLPD